MARYNIEMNQFDGSQYNQLYPRTLLNNVTDWSNTLYTKTEIDNQKNEIMNAINETSPENGSLLASAEIQINTSRLSSDKIVLPKPLRNYRMISIYISSDRDNIILGANTFYLRLSRSSNSVEWTATFFVFPMNEYMFVIGASNLERVNYMDYDSSPACCGRMTLSSSRDYVSVGGQSFSTGATIDAYVYGY